MTTELVVICVDCGSEFAEGDGWVDRCAECYVILDDHDSGMHAAFLIDCILCDTDETSTERSLQAA